MRAATKEDFRSLLHLISLGVVGAATVGGFFGVGFIWLTDRHPTAPLADQLPSAQPLNLHEVPPPVKNDTALGQSMTALSTASTLPRSDAAATSNRAGSAFVPAAAGATFTPPAKITHSKTVRVRLRLHRRQATATYPAAPWRPDARAGPLPGGGFYGPPNVNVGYINPR